MDTIEKPAIETWPMGINDLPWALELAWRRYKNIDPGASVAFYLKALQSKVTLKIRTDYAFCIATLVNPAWRPEDAECHVLVLCADVAAHWEAVTLLRETVHWSKEQNCTRWWFSSDTGYKVDALCRRVGAIRQTRYLIDF